MDCDYVDNPDNEGEIGFLFYNLSNEPVIIEKGDKLGQGIFQKYYITDDDKTEVVRTGGFGSTDESLSRAEINKKVSDAINDALSEGIRVKYNPVQSVLGGLV